MTDHVSMTPENTMTALPEHFKARIDGKVQHRVGDGPLADLPIGQEVQVDIALASMVLSWRSEGQPITVTIAREEFLLYVDEGNISILR